MSERVRERSSGFRETRDFRVGLVSIFVDNLNPKVDVRCLWDVFKVFGRVRHVFLSSKVSVRRSKFAFIRFQTVDEASKVAKSTHGMLVYWWAIVSKVEFQNNIKEKKSYLEVVSEGLSVRKEREGDDYKKTISMSVEGLTPDEDWLKRSAVGVLKAFFKVSEVNQGLASRGIPFSTSYLGDKSIIWLFNSEDVRDSFINNKLLWKNCFSSMTKSCDFITPQARLAWLACMGVPLKWWSNSFFMRLGWIIGEPLLVEENTRLRKRCDKGRILAFIPYNQSWPQKVKVANGRRSFTVSVMEEVGPVDVHWLYSFLDLKEKKIGKVVLSDTNSNSERDEAGNE
ncbi:hypothetical protein Dsin_020995 [Dipteronia sinensis]|uniref:RRM domain-containing protein n=1 Tax=Dipteronia sinensis TaxID=43782 RepID=A0AAE0AB26_9ROSI|nr:hypothetical protein Dsin_020995 [Dipteronia sinensis]